MAVVSVQAVSTRVSGEADGHRTYTSTWRVITNSRQDGASTASIASGLPTWGSYYRWGTGSGPGGSNSWDLGAWVHSRPTATLQSEQDSLKVWLVTITHTSRSRTPEDTYPDDPLSAPWEVSRDADEWTEEAVETVDSPPKPIWNSALRAIGGKATEIYKTRSKWTLAKNFATVPASWLNDLERSMNSSSVTIVGLTHPPKTLYMRKIAVQVLYFAVNTRYFRCTFYIDQNPETHNLKLIDKGRHKWDGVGDKNDPESYVEITDKETANPQPDGSYFLDGEGGLLQKDADPVLLRAPAGDQVYYTHDWNVIGFPT
jgi:hypothetical protein